MLHKHTKALPVILMTILIDLIGIGILIPVMPQLLTNPDSPAYLLSAGMTVDQGYVIFGALIAAYPLAQFFASPILGQLSDRFGRRPILLYSIFGTAIGYALFAVAIMTRNIPLLFFSRILPGITGGNLPVAQAAIADISTPNDRTKNFGYMGAAFGLGFIIGPYIGGQMADPSVLSWFGPTVPFWFAALLALINMTLLWLFLPETSPRQAKERVHVSQALRHIVKAFTHERLRALFFITFLFQGGFGFFTTFFGVYLIDRYGFTESATGNFFAYVGMWIVLTQAIVTPRASRLWSERRILNVTLIATGLALLLFLWPGAWTTMLWTTPIFALFNGVTQANMMAFLSRSAGADVQGEILGINSSVTALSQSLPPILSGFIAAQTSPTATIYVASVIMVIAGMLFIVFVRREPTRGVGEASIAH